MFKEEQQLVSLINNKGELVVPFAHMADYVSMVLHTQGIDCVVVCKEWFYAVRPK